MKNKLYEKYCRKKEREILDKFLNECVDEIMDLPYFKSRNL